eukprot:15482330-Alexandrium_andersonii.AAC.1
MLGKLPCIRARRCSTPPRRAGTWLRDRRRARLAVGGRAKETALAAVGWGASVLGTMSDLCRNCNQPQAAEHTGTHVLPNQALLAFAWS